VAAIVFAAASSVHAAPFAYVASLGGDAVFQYGLDSGGSFSPLVPSAVATGESPNQVAVSPDGRSV
jgi:hypothetical protein